MYFNLSSFYLYVTCFLTDTLQNKTLTLQEKAKE